MTTPLPSPIDEATARTIAAAIGITIPEDRLAAVAARFQELLELARPLDDADLGLTPPAVVFDPSWATDRSAS